MSDFTHLHVHSHYSLLDGLGRVDLLVERAKELGMKAMALTDHGVMYGVIDFVKTAREAGIKPIVGVEAYIAPHNLKDKRGKADTNPHHITLLAQNDAGYHNLIKLTTMAHLDGYYYKPRIDYEALSKYSEGLIALSGCMSSDISKAILEGREEDIERLIKWHLDVFGNDRFYLEVQHHPNIEEQKKINDRLLDLASQYKMSAAATCDVHYIRPEDAEAQDVLLCVQTGKTVQDKDRLCMLGEDFSLKSPEVMIKAWQDNPEVIAATQKITEMCEVNFKFGVNKLPRFPLPKGVTADEKLRAKCEKSLKSLYGKEKEEEAASRLEYELEVITKTGFASYFLIVADFVNEAKRRGILVGPGRGSAAGSIVAYLMKITGIDPLYYNLLFERFLNPERISMPDIDLDFADDRRDEVIDYVRHKYGADHVAQIITFGTMAARASVRDAGRALGYPYLFCDQVAKTIPMSTNFEQALQAGSELKEMYDQDPQVRRLVDTASKLEGVCRHASTHAAGVVITEDALTNHVPLQKSTTGGAGSEVIVTQYAMNDVEALGLLKMDFLGLKNLTIITKALKIIAQRQNITIDINKLPLDDEDTYKVLQEGKTTGVFQLESSGMKRCLRELVPTEFEDIISMVALYRPGPMDSIPDFIAAKHGRKQISYLHPILKPILEKTYGVIVTQDQVLQIAREFAGFSYAEADILRKAVGKKIRKLLIEQRDKFIEGAVKNKNIDQATAKKVWDFIEPFARYGFNRAHAVCYAMIAYQTAYLKARFPAEFMAALLTSDEGNVDRQAIEVAEALSMDIPVLPPDINESEHDFTVIKNEDGRDGIRFGLGATKNVGHNVVDAIIMERNKGAKYKDVYDVFRRVDCKDFNRKSVESLAKAGAFDSVAERKLIINNLDKLLDFNRSLHKKIDTKQQGLFGQAQEQLTAPRVTLEPTEPASKDECLGWEKELLGLYLSEHPLLEWQKDLEKIAVPLNELATLRQGSGLRVAGVITKINKIITKSQQPMLFVTIEDMVSTVEVLVFPALLESTGSEIWEEGNKVLIAGKLSDKDGEAKVLADRVWLLTKESLAQMNSNMPPPRTVRAALSLQTAKSIVITLPSALPRNKLDDLRDELEKNKSNLGQGVAVELRVPKDGSFETVISKYRLARRERVLKTLANIVGSSSLGYKA